MTFGVLGASPGCDLVIDDPDAAGVSFPGFWELLARAEEWSADDTALPRRTASSPPSASRSIVVAIDGSAGSGKSTRPRKWPRGWGSVIWIRARCTGRLPSPCWSPNGVKAWRASPRPNWTRSASGSIGAAMRCGSGSGDAWFRTKSCARHLSPLRYPGFRRYPSFAITCWSCSAPPLRVRGWLPKVGTWAPSSSPVPRSRSTSTPRFANGPAGGILQRGGASPSPDEIEAEAVRLERRDERDSTRAIAPLKHAEGSVTVDTTALDPRGQAEAIVQLALPFLTSVQYT